MRELNEEFGSGSGGGGWSFEIRGHCHGCGRSEAQDKIKATWLEPVHIRQRGGWLQTQLCPHCARWNLRYWIKVRLRWRIGRISDWLAPGFSHCKRCRTNWHFCHDHSTRIDEGGGMFALCGLCWAELKPEERLRFYRAVFDEWPEPRPYPWESIEWAVMREAS